MITVWKNYRFILSERSEFHTADNLSIAVYAFPVCMLISLSIDEILLSWHMKCLLISFDEMAPSCLKLMNCVLLELA